MMDLVISLIPGQLSPWPFLQPHGTPQNPAGSPKSSASNPPRAADMGIKTSGFAILPLERSVLKTSEQMRREKINQQSTRVLFLWYQSPGLKEQFAFAPGDGNKLHLQPSKGRALFPPCSPYPGLINSSFGSYTELSHEGRDGAQLLSLLFSWKLSFQRMNVPVPGSKPHGQFSEVALSSQLTPSPAGPPQPLQIPSGEISSHPGCLLCHTQTQPWAGTTKIHQQNLPSSHPAQGKQQRHKLFCI